MNLKFEVKTDNTGSYNFDLNPLTTYEILVSKDGYLNNKVVETTVGIDKNTDIVKDIIWILLRKNYFSKIEYDFAKSELRPKSILDLDYNYI